MSAHNKHPNTYTNTNQYTCSRLTYPHCNHRGHNYRETYTHTHGKLAAVILLSSFPFFAYSLLFRCLLSSSLVPCLLANVFPFFKFFFFWFVDIFSLAAFSFTSLFTATAAENSANFSFGFSYSFFPELFSEFVAISMRCLRRLLHSLFAHNSCSQCQVEARLFKGSLYCYLFRSPPVSLSLCLCVCV